MGDRTFTCFVPNDFRGHVLVASRERHVFLCFPFHMVLTEWNGIRPSAFLLLLRLLLFVFFVHIFVERSEYHACPKGALVDEGEDAKVPQDGGIFFC